MIVIISLAPWGREEGENIDRIIKNNTGIFIKVSDLSGVTQEK
jgi:hypothetical protein